MSTSGSNYNISYTVYSRSVQIDPSYAEPIYYEISVEQYFTVALVTALIYHSMISMDKEVKYFWPRPENPVSLIYFANRYIGLLGIVSNIILYRFSQDIASCRFSFFSGGICSLITTVLIDYILVIRVVALYHQHRKLDICLKCLLALEAVLGASLLIYGSIFEEVVLGIMTDEVTICTTINYAPKTLTIISWSMPLVFGFILLLLALYKSAEYWKLSAGFRGFHLVKVLIQDQILYFGFVILCCVLKIVEACIVDANIVSSGFVNAIGSPTLLCILGGQLLINLKEAGELGVNEGTNYRSESVSDIDFAEGPQAEEASVDRSITGNSVELENMSPT